jgi:hypothetical protein
MITRFFASVARKKVGGTAFPDFDKILDFTSAGSESSTSVDVNGDTDLEYKIICRNFDADDRPLLRLNNASTGYGAQYIQSSSGTITAARGTATDMGSIAADSGFGITTLLTPSGFIKTSFLEKSQYSSGTTNSLFIILGYSYNSTANITTLDFISESGNFTAGTRIIVYVRKVNT